MKVIPNDACHTELQCSWQPNRQQQRIELLQLSIKNALPVIYRSQGCHELTSKSKYSLSLPYFALTGPENLQRTDVFNVSLLSNEDH